MDMALRLDIAKFEELKDSNIPFRELFLNFMGAVIGNRSLLQEYEQLLQQCERLKGDDLKEQHLSGYVHNRFMQFSQQDADRFTEILMRNYGLRTDVKLNTHFYLQFLSRFSDKSIEFLVNKVNAVPEKLKNKKFRKCDDKKTLLVEFGYCRKNQISFFVDSNTKKGYTFFTTFRRDSMKR